MVDFNPAVPHPDSTAFFERVRAEESPAARERISRSDAIVVLLLRHHEREREQGRSWNGFPHDSLTALLAHDPRRSASRLLEEYVSIMSDFFASIHTWDGVCAALRQRLSKFEAQFLLARMIDPLRESFSTIEARLPGDVSLDNRDAETLYNSLFFLCLSRQLTPQLLDYAREHVVPNLLHRLDEMISNGFPLTRDDRERIAHKLSHAPVQFGHVLDFNDILAVTSKGRITLSSKCLTDFLIPTVRDITSEDLLTIDALNHFLVHEYVHIMAGSTISPVRANRPGDTSSIEYAHIRQGFHTTRKHGNITRILDEAYAEALGRWLLSSLTPDFGSMGVGEFLYGPDDVERQRYKSEQVFCGDHLDGIGLPSLVGAYHEDFVSGGTPGMRAKSRISFLNEFASHIPGGMNELNARWGGDVQRRYHEGAESSFGK